MADRLTRLIRIYNRLKRGPLTIEVTVKWAKGAGINVSERQLYRDLNSLQHLHIAPGENVVEFCDEKNKKTWKLEYDGRSENVTQFDINSFFLFKNFVPASIQQHRKDSLEKFEQILYKNFSNNRYEKGADAAELYLRRTNYLDIIYGETEHQQLEELIWALQNKRVLVITANEVNSSDAAFDKNAFPVTFWPFEMWFHFGRVYIAGLEAASKELFIYLINNQFLFEPTPDTFNRQKNFKTYLDQTTDRFGITQPISNKVYNIKVEFSEGYGLSSLKSFMHSSAVWKKLKNGNYMLHMTCSINRELIGFLGLSLDKVKVHSPNILRDLLIKKFRATLELYDGKEVDEERANRDY